MHLSMAVLCVVAGDVIFSMNMDTARYLTLRKGEN